MKQTINLNKSEQLIQICKGNNQYFFNGQQIKFIYDDIIKQGKALKLIQIKKVQFYKRKEFLHSDFLQKRRYFHNNNKIEDTLNLIPYTPYCQFYQQIILFNCQNGQISSFFDNFD